MVKPNSRIGTFLRMPLKIFSQTPRFHFHSLNPNQPVKIVFLYSEVSGHVVGLLKALANCDQKTEINVVHWDKKHTNSTKFIITEEPHLKFHPRSSFSDDDLIDFLIDRQPHIVYVSGWMDKGYLRALRFCRAAGGNFRVVCGIDDQWEGTLRQHLGQIYFRMFYASLIDFMWVSGKPQYHYAQRFGYDHERIISNLLSADEKIFNQQANLSKRFVFVGRFDPVKGLDILLDAYLSLPLDLQRIWPLVLIGDGQLRQYIERKRNANIIAKPFLQPNDLKTELMKGGVACITSHSEQWGVAIQEMAILGYPLILSSACGAATEFLISGYNGFLFTRSNTASLRHALLNITTLGDKQLQLFSTRSHTLGQRISSEHAAYSMLSVLSLSDSLSNFV